MFQNLRTPKTNNIKDNRCFRASGAPEIKNIKENSCFRASGVPKTPGKADVYTSSLNSASVLNRAFRGPPEAPQAPAPAVPMPGGHWELHVVGMMHLRKPQGGPVGLIEDGSAIELPREAG
jgi:hypothetical protein